MLDRTMSAVRKSKSAPGFDWVAEMPVPSIGPREVLIAVTHVGICGTDRHIYEWDPWSRARLQPPVTVGHEFVGRVAAVGDAVTRARTGDRVTAEGHIGCGVCRACRTGNGHICQHVQILGIDRDGAFAQYVAVPEDNLWPVHPNIPDHIAAVLDPLGNAVHTVMAAGVSGKSVLITGAGMIGLMAVEVAKAVGAGKILVTDTNSQRLDLAQDLGADIALCANSDDWAYEARLVTGGLGPEVLLEMSGSPAAIEAGFDVLRPGGTAALLGLPAQPVKIDLANQIIFKSAKVLGINGRRLFETWYQMEDLLLAGRLNLDPIITHQLPLENFQRGIELMQQGEAIKVVLEVPHEERRLCPAPPLNAARPNC